ncbi:unnamed protein product, partial [Mesorhabditis belari]|uniref:Uncharacterized protein n=1 Tax=Mesorhabditis belari TaxID=2138241 RepID=A0AAF3JAH1_9BILA
MRSLFIFLLAFNVFELCNAQFNFGLPMKLFAASKTKIDPARLRECETAYNASGAWMDKTFDPETNVNLDDSDFYLHTMFIGSVKSAFVQKSAKTFYACVSPNEPMPVDLAAKFTDSFGNNTNNTLCDPTSRQPQCPAGSECYSNGINPFTKVATIPSSLRSFNRLSYCRPIEIKEGLDDNCFEANLPYIEKVVPIPPNEEAENVDTRLIESTGDLRPLQTAFQAQSRCLKDGKIVKPRDVLTRKKRGFGRWFKKFIRKVVKVVVVVIQVGCIILEILGQPICRFSNGR